MALNSGKILMRRGQEVNFDPNKMMPGEWAVSLDSKFVRMCFSPGVCVRMATYEAFEEDMKRVEAILLECQTVEEAVIRINTEVSAKANAVVELVEQAKTYRDEAEQFRNEAESFKNQAGEIVGIDIATTERAGISKPDGETLEIDPDGTLRVIGGGGVSDYEEIENKPSINNVELSGNKTLEELGIASKEVLDKTVFKVDTIIEKADLGIKETAIGEEIHLTDSAEGKAVEFALYGKTTQDGEPTPENPQEIEVSGASYNLLENTATSKTINGVEFVVNEDKSITLNGTANNSVAGGDSVIGSVKLEKGKYILSGCPSGGSNDKYRLIAIITYEDGTTDTSWRTFGNEVEFNIQKEVREIIVRIDIISGVTANNLTFYPMIRKATVKNTRYIPYGVGSVEVKSVGKNLIPYPAYQQNKTQYGMTFNQNADGSVSVSGTHENSQNRAFFELIPWSVSGNYNHIPVYANKSYKVTCKNLPTNFMFFVVLKDLAQSANIDSTSLNADTELIYTPKQDGLLCCGLHQISGIANEVVTPATCYPMISIEGGEYEPYKETKAIINGEYAGIKVSSGGNYTDTNGQQWICDEVVKYADGSGAYIQRVGKVVFDGSETWNYIQRTDRELLFTNALNGLGKVGQSLVPFMCDYFKSYNGGAHWEGYNGTFPIMLNTATSNTQCSILAKVGTYGSADTWKGWLTSNSITVYYELAEPITTSLTAEEIADIETFYPVTNITNDFDCGMKVKYKCDGKNYIDKRLALIEQALINNI